MEKAATNGTLTPTEARAILEQVPTVTPQEAMQQVAELLASLGYDDLAAVAVSPRFGNQVNPYEFIPDGWRLVILPMKAKSK